MPQQQTPAVEVRHLSKSFQLPHNRQNSIKGNLINLVSRGDRTYETQEVLKDISFEIQKGEFFGIVGRNGSGKSTLLKLLAGIYYPSSGAVKVNGSLTPFIELGVGFNPDLTGRENVYLNGALLGFSNSEMDAMYKDIVEFAELERFMDQKLKNYSSGMQVRLAFSIAIRAKSDILLFDEVLAVGDADFQKKCVATFRELKKENRTIVLVTHDMGQVERFCDRALVLSNGAIKAIASPSDAAMIYAKLNVNEARLEKNDSKRIQNSEDRPGNGVIRVEKLQLSNGLRKTRLFTTNDQFTVHVTLSSRVPEGTKLAVGLAVHTSDGTALFGPNTDRIPIPSGSQAIQYMLPHLPLNAGEYSVTVALYDAGTREEFDVLFQALHFSVVKKGIAGGAVPIEGEWSFAREARV